jgi:hypothetical protein
MEYHAKCVELLTKMSLHDETYCDENLFAATIILRVLEEMDGKHLTF